MRRSAFKTKRGPPFVYGTDFGIAKTFGNISVSADQICNDKRGFEFTRPIPSNTDTKAIAMSDGVLAVLRPELETFSLPHCR
jgi:hypothetical protein